MLPTKYIIVIFMSINLDALSHYKLKKNVKHVSQITAENKQHLVQF